MNDPTIPFAGSQFGSDLSLAQSQDEHFDPALYGLTSADVQALLQFSNQAPINHHQRNATESPPSGLAHQVTPSIDGYSFNPQAAPFTPQPFASSDWRTGNPLTHLNPEASSYLPQSSHTALCLSSDGYRHTLHPSTPAYGYDYLPRTIDNLGELASHQLRGQPSAPTANTPDPPANSNIPLTTIGQLNFTPPAVPSPDIASWTRTTYNPGAPVHGGAAPLPNPVTTVGQSRRHSIAPSATTSTSFTCEIDGREFAKLYEYNHHMRWHGEKEHVCDSCGKGFVKPTDLIRHEKSHDKTKRHLFCDVIGCKYHDLGFNRMDAFIRHIRVKHPGNLLTPASTASGHSRQRNGSASVSG